MPLTIDETIAAIRALDTEKDIILGACERIIQPPKTGDDINTLVSDMIFRYRGEEAALTAVAFITAGARMLGVMTIPGKELVALVNTRQLLDAEFNDAVFLRLKRKFAENPQEAIDGMVALLTSIPDEKPR